MKQIVVVGLSALAIAAWAAASPGSAAAQEGATVDEVHLTSGEVLQGHIVAQQPGSYVTLRLTDGSETTLAWGGVARLVDRADVPPAAPVAAAAAPVVGTTTTTAKLDTSGASYQQAVNCDTPGQPCAETTAVEVSGSGANYHKEANCGGPGHPCMESTGVQVNGNGAAAEYQKTEVTAVKSPKKGSTNVSADVGLAIGSPTNDEIDMSMIGFSMGLGLSIMTGGLFPGEAGGKWMGLFMEPAVIMQYMKTSMTINGEEYGGTFTSFDLGASAGVAFLNFNGLDTTNLTQSGFGVTLGGRVGYQFQSSKSDDAYAATTNKQASYGLVMGLLFPKYNPGTAKATSFYLRGMILPTSDFLFTNINVGGTL